VSDRAGVRIGGRFYPFVDQFKHGDPILIMEVTGLDWDTFSDMLAKAGDDPEGRVNPIVQTALIAVAVQREHKTWSRREVSDYIRDLDLGGEEYVPGSEDKIEGDALPPLQSGESSSNSEETSGTSPESPSSLSLISSGDPGLDTTTPESRQVG
jgi:hypothetical protein